MKKIFLILITIIFFFFVAAHDTKKRNYDSHKNCTKKKSALNWVSKNKLSKGGEIIQFQSYSGFN